MTRKRIITIVAIIAAAGILVKGKMLLNERQHEVASEPTPMADALSIPVVKAHEGMLHHTVTLLARIEAHRHIQLSTKMAGYVKKIYVKEAEAVQKDTLLASIDAEELHSSIKALESTLHAQTYDLEVSKSIYMRNLKLHRVGGLSREKLDISKAALDSKKAQISNTDQKISQLKHQLDYLQIRAPFEGTIDTIQMHEGDLAAAGKPILYMSDAGQKLLLSYAPDRKITIKPGQAVMLGGKEVGTIRAIYPTASNGLVTAEVKLKKVLNRRVGTTVSVEVLMQEKKGCIVPSNALLHKKEGIYVMQHYKGKFVPLRIQVEMQSDNGVMVSPCPSGDVAVGREVKLAVLPAYGKVHVSGEAHE